MEINKIGNNLEIIVPITKYYSHLLFFGIGAIVYVLGTLIVILKSIFTSNFNVTLEFFGYFVFGIIFTTYSLWLLIGKEKMLIENDSILITKTNGILTIRKTYEINKISKIQTVEKKYKSENFIDVGRENIREKQKAFPFWIKMGKIKFQYQNKEITIFNGLNSSEINEVFELLKTEIENKKTNEQ